MGPAHVARVDEALSEGRWGDFGVELSSLSDSDIFCSGRYGTDGVFLGKPQTYDER